MTLKFIFKYIHEDPKINNINTQYDRYLGCSWYNILTQSSQKWLLKCSIPFETETKPINRYMMQYTKWCLIMGNWEMIITKKMFPTKACCRHNVTHSVAFIYSIVPSKSNNLIIFLVAIIIMAGNMNSVLL